ncbi:TonB family protein [Novilysobacter defluvii]|uniref:Protein TonB n=1 Tax=Lysobacter defluvii IMMIB APB-9 = DSM 18482 TaxID=1385515 RepID=A0A0A0MAU7_9GAMM|nr:TonB family protein [Lysobacter defluvii]KGO99569.1 energy transducer TonB [Lysobacter defluvii IMMIB APB-9 = DSM 18482]
MASAELLAWLAQSTFAGSIAVAAVLLARRPMRRLFGARVAYALWILVPLALLAVAMPAPDPTRHGPAVVKAVASLQMHAAGGGAAAGSAPLLWAWAAGVLASAALFGIAQRRFVRSLGPLRPRADGLHQAAGAHGLPAVIGLVRPRIVVPPDFASCYDDTERRLVRLHEQLHIRSGDLVANAAAIALRCLFWFNPLVHLAWRHFRHDQELACDQRVLERHPRKRRQYGAAMLKTQLAASPLPLACTWGYGHPLKERIAMLKQPLPSSRRRLAGATAACLLASTVAFASWAAQPSGGTTPVTTDVESRLLNPPSYPAHAVEQKIEGKVVLIVEVDASGKPRDVVVESAEPAGVFEEAAVEAVHKWLFNPATEDGRPVSSRVRVPVTFAMDPPEGQGAN